MLKIPLGKQNFDDLGPYYYVDKTHFIVDLIETGEEVTLITRPRRFGKTLMLTTLQSFFELEYDANGNPVDKAVRFEGLAVSKASQEVLQHMGAHPVIYLTFSDLDNMTYEEIEKGLKTLIVDEARRLIYTYDLLQNSLVLRTFPEFEDLKFLVDTRYDFVTLLAKVARALNIALNRKVVILLDEYDVPINAAYVNDVKDTKIYNDRVEEYQLTKRLLSSFVKSLFKTNRYIQMAVVTGALQVARAGIFTGLNSLRVYSAKEKQYSEAFGFTHHEVEELLHYYGLSDRLEEVQEWYDGYRFGNSTIYNPWSLLSFIQDIRKGNASKPKCYWVNTSSNDLVKSLINTHSEHLIRANTLALIEGKTIDVPLSDMVTFEDLYDDVNSVWNLLYHTGYLTIVSERRISDIDYYCLRVVNREVLSLFKTILDGWLTDKFTLESKVTKQFVVALLTGKADEAQSLLQDLIMGSLSYFDLISESNYHTFVAGLLTALSKQTSSNYELGSGRPDLVYYPLITRGGRPNANRETAIIFEFKLAYIEAALPEAAENALAQIVEKRYVEGARAQGCKDVVTVGISFFGKQVCVRLGESPLGER